MSAVGNAFVAGIGRPDPPAPNGLTFPEPFDDMWWRDVHGEIGSGWYLDRFLYLFGEGLEAFLPCLEAWSFLLGPEGERMIVGRNAYGALLVAEEPSERGVAAPIGVLDPLNVRYWANPDVAFGNLIGNWLPTRALPDFFDTSLYMAWREVTGDVLELSDALVMKQPKPLGGRMEAANFQIEDLVDYYRTTGPIYARALGEGGG